MGRQGIDPAQQQTNPYYQPVRFLPPQTVSQDVSNAALAELSLDLLDEPMPLDPPRPPPARPPAPPSAAPPPRGALVSFNPSANEQTSTVSTSNTTDVTSAPPKTENSGDDFAFEIEPGEDPRKPRAGSSG